MPETMQKNLFGLLLLAILVHLSQRWLRQPTGREVALAKVTLGAETGFGQAEEVVAAAVAQQGARDRARGRAGRRRNCPGPVRP